MLYNIIQKISKFLLAISLLTMLTQCSTERQETVSCFPQSLINVQININLPAYRNLWYANGWIYLDQQGAGTRGLIIVRIDDTHFKAYDRNAPHLCPDTDTTLEVKDGIKIICPKDGAKWILRTGEPSKVAKVPPKTYYTIYEVSSGTLIIKN